MNNIRNLFTVLITVLTTSLAQAGEVTIPNSFSAGSTAVAAEVNGNFTAVSTAVNDNNGRVFALETLVNDQQTIIADLQNRLAAVEANNVQALNNHVELITDPLGNPTVQFRGVNLQVINGIDQTTANGLGNLMVGYNLVPEGSNVPRTFCSNGQHADQPTCEANGGTWSNNQRTGSHNMIVGSHHGYSSTGGVVFGIRNAISRESAVVTGGRSSLARGFGSSVSGGLGNTASGSRSSVSGGSNNTASGFIGSSVSGGFGRTAAGANDWVAGSLFEEL